MVKKKTPQCSHTFVSCQVEEYPSHAQTYDIGQSPLCEQAGWQSSCSKSVRNGNILPLPLSKPSEQNKRALLTLQPLLYCFSMERTSPACTS